MTMQQYQDLYLAASIEELDRIALNKIQQTLRVKKPTVLLNVAKKLFNTCQNNPLDEEMTYILLYRSIQVYEHLLSVHNDKNFVHAILGNEYRNAKLQIKELKDDLIGNYKKVEIKEVVNVTVPLPASVAECSTVFNGLYITCLELYNAFFKNNVNLLIMDTRNEEDFVESHIKDVTCINIPDSCIKSGLSANQLGLLLPKDSKEIWNKRASFTVIILVDWNTTNKNYSASKLEKLRTTMVDWDIGVVYKEGPVVLNGGYKEWLDVYPMFCTCPAVILKRANIELDDLLDLDSIEYPLDSQHVTHENQLYKLDIPQHDDDVGSPLELLTKKKSLLEENTKIVQELLQCEQLCFILTRESLNVKDDNTKLKRVQNEIKNAEKKMIDLTKKNRDIIRQIDEKEYSLKVAPIKIESKENNDILDAITKLRNTYRDLYKAHQELARERQQLLDQARKAKKPLINIVDKKPTINRETKPKSFLLIPLEPIEGRLQQVRDGLTGLVNIKNTCYMNTAIQCFRNLPTVMKYFCDGVYYETIKRGETFITKQTAHLICNLWSNSYSVIKPIEFYNAFIKLQPLYKAGRHEDCMEFFLALFNFLNQDDALDVTSESSWSDRELAWHQQHNGKRSFYTDMFFHQKRVHSYCKKCRSNSLKFEIDNAFYLSIPKDRSFNLEDCFNENLNHEETITCKNCALAKRISKSFSYCPPIVIIVLKRYYEDKEEKTIVKNEHRCNFPLKDFKIDKGNYTLHSVALHSGNMSVGHYRAVCRNLHSKEWILFNDEKVTSVDITDDDIKRQAYAFFYESKDVCSVFNENRLRH